MTDFTNALKNHFPNLRLNYPLKKATTMKIGGPAKYFLIVKTEKALIEAIKLASKLKIPWQVIGQGTNIIAADAGFQGLIIKNQVESFQHHNNKVSVGAGHDLFDFIKKLNHLGLAGMENMAGIPGTVAGAIYGNAGAYGQEIKDQLLRVKVFDGQKVRFLANSQCQFGYRESVFKAHKNWIILKAEFKLENQDPQALNHASDEIIQLRLSKYQPSLASPGSFFKNILIHEIKPKSKRQAILTQLDPKKVVFGKIPTGYLLELIGAKGMKIGGIAVADYHANLIYNLSSGTAADVRKLAHILKRKTKARFGLNLEEEIQYLGFSQKSS